MSKRYRISAGNALFLILIAVALFAALSYAITQSSRGGGNTDREKVEIATAQLMNHLALVQSTIDRMLLSGVTLDQVTFCGPADTDGYCYATGTGDDAVCTTGSTCVFAPDGGGLGPPIPIDLSIARVASGVNGWEFYEIQGAQAVETMGTAAADLVYRHTRLTQEACEIIHARMDVPLPLLQDAAGGAKGGAYPDMEPIQCSFWFNGTDWLPGLILSPGYQ